MTRRFLFILYLYLILNAQLQVSKEDCPAHYISKLCPVKIANVAENICDGIFRKAGRKNPTTISHSSICLYSGIE